MHIAQAQAFMLADVVVVGEAPANRPLGDFNVWGKASAANVKISAKASWAQQEYTCKADANATWVLEIPVPAAPSDGAP